MRKLIFILMFTLFNTSSFASDQEVKSKRRCRSGNCSVRAPRANRPTRPNRPPRANRQSRPTTRPTRINRPSAPRPANPRRNGTINHGNRRIPPSYGQRPNRRTPRSYRRDTHTPYRNAVRHQRRYNRIRNYQQTIPSRYIYQNRWLRFTVSRYDGYYYNDYPYFIFNGYRHRYSAYDMCNYELVDSRINRVVDTFYGRNCSAGYDQCSFERNRKNDYEYDYRYFCSEKFELRDDNNYGDYNDYNQDDSYDDYDNYEDEYSHDYDYNNDH